MSYDPAPTKKDWLDLIEVVPPEYIVLLAVCGLVALCYLSIRGVSVCGRAIRSLSDTSWVRPTPPRTDLASTELSQLVQLLAPHVAASQLQALQQQEQLRLEAASLPSRITTGNLHELPSTSAAFSCPPSAPTFGDTARVRNVTPRPRPTPTRRSTRSSSIIGTESQG